MQRNPRLQPRARRRLDSPGRRLGFIALLGFFQAPGFTLDVDDFGMVGDAVDQRNHTRRTGLRDPQLGQDDFSSIYDQFCSDQISMAHDLYWSDELA